MTSREAPRLQKGATGEESTAPGRGAVGLGPSDDRRRKPPHGPAVAVEQAEAARDALAVAGDADEVMV